MSEADATDPVKALREAIERKVDPRDLGEHSVECSGCLNMMDLEAPATLDTPAYCSVCAYEYLDKAPALLARIEAGEAELTREIAANVAERGDNIELRGKVKALESRLAEAEAGYFVEKRGHDSEIRRALEYEARLAEMAPVVEAAERVADVMRLGFGAIPEDDLVNAVTALRAARSLRGAGEGGGA